MPDDDLSPDDPRWAYAFTIEEAGEIGDRPGLLLRGSREAVKAAARMFAEAVVVVPMEPNEAMVERAARAIHPGCFRHGTESDKAACRDEARAALRAALNPEGR